MAITIKKLEIENELFRHLGRGDTPQGCFVELDCEDAVLTARYNPEIGNAVPEAVYHRRILRWAIPHLRTSAANALMIDIIPLCERIIDGYECIFDGNNLVGSFTADAEAADSEIGIICDQQMQYDEDHIQWADAADWYLNADSPVGWAIEWGITPTTTDDELAAIGARLQGEEDTVLIHLDRFLDRCRDAAAQAADEADDADADDAGEVLP